MAGAQGLGPGVVAALLCLSAAASADAQTTGKIEGRVSDSSGSALPGVTVGASGPSLQGVRVGVTEPDGAFRFAALPPGRYRVAVALSGFRGAERTAIVSLDSTATVDFVLHLETREEVVVSGEAPLIDMTATTTGTNYTSAVIAHLPTARNYADIVKANPGVSTDRGNTEGRSLALTVYGATSAENLWIIDGVNTTNPFKGVQGKAINNEFVQEVEVKTGGYQAEYGRALGGVINVITKSGGNDFHGDGFVYYDSTATAAEKEFKPGDSGLADMRVVDGERYDYGLDLGGFLLQDRLWFFGAYNRVTIDSEVSRLESHGEVSTDDRFPIDAATNLYSGKLTWHVANATTVVGTVFADPSKTSGAAAADPRQGLGVGDVEPPVSLARSTWYSERSQGGTDFGLRAIQLFGARAMATLQGSYHKDANDLTAPDGARYLDETCTGGTPEEPCVRPLEPNAIFGGFGRVFGASDHSSSQRQQYAAGLTLYAGNHELKLGADYQDGETEALDFFTGGQLVRIRNEEGLLYYRHTFIAAGPDGPFLDLPQSARVLDYGFYIQDSWRVAPGLTVNVGLRWDGEQLRDYTGQTILNFGHQWQPRIGIAWDPWRDGATKLYAFAGRFSYALPTAAILLPFFSTSAFTTYNFDPVGVTQDDATGHPMTGFSASVAQNLDPDLRNWYQDELTAGVERLILPTLTVGLKGTYRTLRNVLEDRCDLDYNSADNDYSPCGLMNPGSKGPIASGNVETCTDLDYPYNVCGIDPGPATPGVSRVYEGLELFARQTIGTNLWIQASYIYSSLQGNYDGGVNQGTYGQTWPGINADFDYPPMWHNADGALYLDRTNRFRLDGYWITPWRLSIGLQAFAETGAPLNRLGYFNEFTGPVIYLDPRGSAGRLPALWGTNLSLSYPFVIGPATVTVQAYLFNVFNKQIAVFRDEAWTIQAPENYPATLYDPRQPSNNSNYGSVMDRSDPRFFRAALKVAF